MSATTGRDRSGAVDPPAPQAPAAVSVRRVNKTFRIPHEQFHTLKERALHGFRSGGYDILQAVQNVSLDIAPGEFFGIVGRNGSGKSTLLKCLAGIYRIDSGELEIKGRLSPFIELGVGFNMELSARDNVIINAVMLGLSRRQAIERFDDIIAFAELEKFVDLKLKNYSSGMYVRLAFATAVQVDADVLLIDEVLAVGDANFQQKCFDEFTRLQKEGRTILFVTHDMSAVERFCDRAMLLERGQVVAIDTPSTVARLYNEENFRRSRIESGAAARDIPPETPIAAVRDAYFRNDGGETIFVSALGDPAIVHMDVHFNETQVDPIFEITLLNETGHRAFITNTVIQQIETGTFEAGSDAAVELRFENYLAPGRYELVATVARAGLGADIFDAHMSKSLLVVSEHAGGGFADLPHTLSIERTKPSSVPPPAAPAQFRARESR